MPYKCHICVKSFFLNNDSNPNIADIHEGKKSYKWHFCDQNFFWIMIWIQTLQLFMREKAFQMSLLWQIWIIILVKLLCLFMNEKSLTNVTFVTKAFFWIMIWIQILRLFMRDKSLTNVNLWQKLFYEK